MADIVWRNLMLVILRGQWINIEHNILVKFNKLFTHVGKILLI